MTTVVTLNRIRCSIGAQTRLENFVKDDTFILTKIKFEKKIENP